MVAHSWWVVLFYMVLALLIEKTIIKKHIWTHEEGIQMVDGHKFPQMSWVIVNLI